MNLSPDFDLPDFDISRSRLSSISLPLKMAPKVEFLRSPSATRSLLFIITLKCVAESVMVENTKKTL